MRVLIQRVRSAEVSVGGERIAAIGPGLVVFIGIERGDDNRDAAWFARRVATMKFFGSETSPWSASVTDVGGAVLAVSQFTLAARTRKGRRPSFDGAARPEEAEPIYRAFVASLREAGLEVQEGRFGARMEVGLLNDGPVTFDLEGPGWARHPDRP